MQIEIGQRVIFIDDLERDPLFTVPCGAYGTIDEIENYDDQEIIWVELDRPMKAGEETFPRIDFRNDCDDDNGNQISAAEDLEHYTLPISSWD